MARQREERRGAARSPAVRPGRGRLSALTIGAVVWAAFTVTAAAATPVDLELVLAVDASRSIDDYEYTLQRRGYAQALTHPEVLRAIQSGEFRRIAIAYVEWSGDGQQATLVDWAVVDGAEAAERFAAALLAAPRRFLGRTSISGALDYAARLFDQNDLEGRRQVIDVSGDGANHGVRTAAAARDDAVSAGITINGLAILNDRPSRPPWPEQRVDLHYGENVIGGPGAFLLVVDGFESFAEGIRKKMVLEIAARPAAREGQRLPRKPGAAGSARPATRDAS